MTLFSSFVTHARALGDRPAVTGITTAGRTELGWTTFVNWVAKTGNLLTEELDVQPGDPVVVATGSHWMTPVVACATAAVGAVPRSTGDGVRVTGEDGGGELVVGDGMGGRVLGATSALTVGDVLAQGDDLIAPAGALADAEAVPGATRWLVTDPFDDEGLRWVVAVLAAGGSLVLLTDPAADPDRVAAAESAQRR